MLMALRRAPGARRRAKARTRPHARARRVRSSTHVHRFRAIRCEARRPARSRSCCRSARSRRCAATAVAQAAEPQARVSPAPRSQTRSLIRRGSITCATEMLARSGKSGWCSSKGPIRARSMASTSPTQKIACGLPMFTADGVCRIGASIGPICKLDAARVGEFLGERDFMPGKARRAHVHREAFVAVALASDEARLRLEQQGSARDPRAAWPRRRSVCRCRKPAPPSHPYCRCA